METANMMEPMQILQEAVDKSEMDLLLLGRSPYAYLPPSSPSTGSTDLAELLRIAYDLWPMDDRNRIRVSLVDAMSKLVSTYDGLEPVAACLLVETLRQAKNRAPLGLPVKEFTGHLQGSIDEFRDRLCHDRSGQGAEWKDGRLGKLRRLSDIVRSLGGIGFVID